MNLTSPAHEAERTEEPPPCAVEWNGAPFLVTRPVIRENRIVRTKLVPPELKRRYNTSGWPRHLVLMREYSVTLPGDDEILKIITNADEAEDELPDRIQTPRRDIGTFRDALVTWRGREVHAFVSARLAVGVCDRLEHTPAVPGPLSAQPAVSAAHMLILQNAMKSGVILRNSRIADALNADERLLVNLLIASRSEDPPRPLSLEDIADLLQVSRETVRRRRDELLARFPHLARAIAPFRTRNLKGVHPDLITDAPAEDSGHEE